MRHFLDVTDLTSGELDTVLALAEEPALPLVLDRRGVALIFEKPSVRTRHSMEMAVVQLGGHPVYTRREEIGFDIREPVEDVARILAGYHAALAARVFRHEVLERMAAVSSVPVINLLSDRSHPMQALADALTMRQLLGPLAGRSVAWLGDWNNVARSLAEACASSGMHVRIATPGDYAPEAVELDRIAALGASSVTYHRHPAEAVEGVDAVHTDVWTSMGQEDETVERKRAFDGWMVTDELLDRAAPDVVFLHCMPAHRGEEVAASVMDGPRSHAIRQGHNRMHAARGLLAFLFAANDR
jgi:ornithine carbamoyltransferase